MEKELLQCFNRGCGQKYDANNNTDDSCRHHPGEPFFHDAYKGWSCCNKKCTDFTEFLNIKGCTVSKHSNVKRPEPEKPVVKEVIVEKKVIAKPIVVTLERPPFNSPLITVTPEISPSLKQQLSSNCETLNSVNNGTEISIGTTCKNSGCSQQYEGPKMNETACIYHPGVPIFHEGLKFWSCCQKRTTDFNAFLNQVGCETGKHLWKKEEDSRNVQCRWDYHQTGTHVIVSIYAKQYCVYSSIIKINPVRLLVSLVFPQQSNASFDLDLELCGIIKTDESQASMYGTKVEIKLRKAEPGSWPKLEITKLNGNTKKSVTNDIEVVDQLAPQVEGVDLGDL